MSELVIIRGCPGSGKSTLAKDQYPNHILIEADQYFISGDGSYRFDPSQIKCAHAWCQKMTLCLLNEGKDVVVANTFTRLCELRPYLEMGYPYTVVVAQGNFKNIHGVPSEVVNRMKANFELLDV